MIFRTLVSGSSGNAILFSDDKTNILIDCGISAKRLIPLLCQAGIPAQDLDYILVTHEHTDHCTGVGVLSRKFNIPVIASVGTWQGMNVGRINPQNIISFQNYDSFNIGSVLITPFEIPHDANLPTGYVIQSKEKRFAVATDMGHVTKNVADTIKGCNSVILEANYDEKMLINGSYPISLINRIGGKLGHLSNNETARFASYLFKNGTEKIILGHLSDENNTPKTAFDTVAAIIEKDGTVLDKKEMLTVAPRYEISINAG
ncbi:MAG: MBL fold metallo-hydrolase [Clostridia bacterium]|nr:MBL fold metallo-hydrolase [Clostridia bacterium]